MECHQLEGIKGTATHPNIHKGYGNHGQEWPPMPMVWIFATIYPWPISQIFWRSYPKPNTCTR